MCPLLLSQLHNDYAQVRASSQASWNSLETDVAMNETIVFYDNHLSIHFFVKNILFSYDVMKILKLEIQY